MSQPKSLLAQKQANKREAEKLDELESLVKTVESKTLELKTLNEVIPSKQSVLDDLLIQIKTAEKTLEDNFSQKKLELQREYTNKVNKLEEDTNKIGQTLVDLADRQKIALSKTEELDIKLADLKFKVSEERTALRVISQENDKIKREVINNRNEKTRLQNDIDSLTVSKKQLDNEISAQVMQKTAEAYEMRTQMVKERDQIQSQINEKKDELRSVQQQLLVNQNKQIEIEEDYKRKNTDLIKRENALIIKGRALAKDQAEFETETRRWNYVKPIPK